MLPQLSPNAKLMMFADDLAYVKPIPVAYPKKVNAEEEHQDEELHQYMEKISSKYRALSLSLNAMKCKSMLFTAFNHHYDLDLEIGNEKIEHVKQFRYLGIDLDPKLCYKNHVAKVKCRQSIGALCRTIKK
uniref:Reverse transcriptase domain-containing protein n=1 Tax=Acrobeloides nanus TaxID=290746 RepID=A0A914C9A6_9BILA